MTETFLSPFLNLLPLEQLPNNHTWFFMATIFFFTGMTKGGVGNGLGALTIIFLSLFVDPLWGLSITLIIFLMSDLISLIQWWDKWEKTKIWFAMRWMVTGGALGSFFLAPIQWGIVSTDILKAVLAGLGLYLTWRWLRATYVQKQSHSTLSLTTQKVLCVVGGFTSTAMNSGGIPLMTYVLSLGLNSHMTHATTVILFSMINCVKLVPYAGLGLLNTTTFLLALSFAPVVVAGAIFGKYLHYRMSDALFNKIAYTGVTLSCMKLLYDITLGG